MRMIVMSGARSVAAVRAHQLLGSGTIFYENVLAPFGASSTQFVDVRRDWHEQALVATTPCDLVFLDPDNGVVLDLKKPGIKHALLSEISDYQSRGQTVVVYHHLGRTDSHAEQLARLRRGLATSDREPITLRAGKGSGRAFVVLPAERHEQRLRARLAEFLAGPWGQLFDAA